jgi:hypothetical protein
LNYWEITELSIFFELKKVLIQDNVIRSPVGVNETKRLVIATVNAGLNQLVHGSDSTACSYHADTLNLFDFHFLGLLVPDLESFPPKVGDVPTDG